MINTLRCNRCGNKGCPYSDKELAKIDARNCKKFVEPESFKVPILVRLIEDGKATIVNDLLRTFGLKIKETHERPYFMLTVKG